MVRIRIRVSSSLMKRRREVGQRAQQWEERR